jgi:predicted TIM-barrel fold metal-dependent hydrolase
MMPIIDLGLDVPPTVEELTETVYTFFSGEQARGLANYRRIFGLRWLASLGLTLEQLDRLRASLPEDVFAARLAGFAASLAVTPEAFLAELDRAGLSWGLISSPGNERTAAFVARAPGRLKGMARVSPFDGLKAVRELERAVCELGLVALSASAFDWGIPAGDRRFYPLYAKAVELDIPVFVYTAMNYRTDLPMDIARPLVLDQIAMDFPEMKIVATCGGWPWVPEMIGVARRHQNVYINTSSHRPRYLATPGSGWEMLMQFGNTLLQEQIVFASGASDMGLPLSVVVEEMLALPLKETVKEKWLYQNARRLFGLD